MSDESEDLQAPPATREERRALDRVDLGSGRQYGTEIGG